MRERLEQYQVLIYLVTIALGLILGLAAPEASAWLDVVLWPVLGLLLYATFTQTPLVRLSEAFRELRLLVAAVIGNFVVIPLLVWAILQVAPGDAAILLGIALVLLVPCTDWFITFTHLGGGDTRRAIAFSPISLLLQLALLPLYLWLFFGGEFTETLAGGDVLKAFVGLILVPLVAAWFTERWAGDAPVRERLIAGLAWFPVPLLALVVFIIAASQVHTVLDGAGVLLPLLMIFGGFLVLAPLFAWMLARAFRLPVAQGRVLAFSFGSRNSFVILPIALALPQGLELAVVVVVFQSLVELVGMALYLWWVPRHLFPEPIRPVSVKGR
ncbi:arsenic resistance protein [Thioalkalivibrio sp. ALJ7]|uniref:arsenic resistance protein n=1 Tax=Thioalkalivibrio sp. ALJ7 TaxID=1158756 RepID=UPI00035F1A44|nr:arsenic resistance protein [Thioalkalivibrio sp. ALJ7]